MQAGNVLVIGAGMHPNPHIHRDAVIVGITGVGTDNVLSCHESSPVMFGDRDRRPTCDRILDSEFAESMLMAG